MIRSSGGRPAAGTGCGTAHGWPTLDSGIARLLRCVLDRELGTAPGAVPDPDIGRTAAVNVATDRAGAAEETDQRVGARGGIRVVRAAPAELPAHVIAANHVRRLCIVGASEVVGRDTWGRRAAIFCTAGRRRGWGPRHRARCRSLSRSRPLQPIASSRLVVHRQGAIRRAFSFQACGLAASGRTERTWMPGARPIN